MRIGATAILGTCALLAACAGDPDVVGSLLTTDMDTGGTGEMNDQDAGFPFEPWWRDASPPPPANSTGGTGGAQTTGGVAPPPPPPCNVPADWLQVARDTCTIPASWFTSGQVDLFEVLGTWTYVVSQQGPFPPTEDCGFGNIVGIRIDSMGNWHFCDGPACEAIKEYVIERNASCAPDP